MDGHFRPLAGPVLTPRRDRATVLQYLDRLRQRVERSELSVAAYGRLLGDLVLTELTLDQQETHRTRAAAFLRGPSAPIADVCNPPSWALAHAARMTGTPRRRRERQPGG